VDFSDPTYIGGLAASVNPTNGSWWIVQIGLFVHLEGLLETNSLLNAICLCFGDVNDPPTSVGGIQGSDPRSFVGWI
jgi:hypothetical protein